MQDVQDKLAALKQQVVDLQNQANEVEAALAALPAEDPLLSGLKSLIEANGYVPKTTQIPVQDGSEDENAPGDAAEDSTDQPAA